MTTFDNDIHRLLFLTGSTLQTAEKLPASEMILKTLYQLNLAHRLTISDTQPGDTTKLWLDKATVPDTLKIWSASNSRWDPVDETHSALGVLLGAGITGAEMLAAATQSSGRTILAVQNDEILARNYLPTGTDAVNRTVISKLEEAWVSIKDFGAVGDGTTDDRDALLAAIDKLPASGGKVIFPLASYKISGTINITKPSVQFWAPSGATLKLGSTLTPGDTAIEINASGFRCRGLAHTADVRVRCYNIVPVDAEIASFIFEDCIFSDFFYAISAMGESDKLVKDLHILFCRTVAPTGLAAGQFWTHYAHGVSYIGNLVIGALNSSAYGITNSSGGDIIVIGNVERDVSDTANDVEAAIQIEDCIGANVVVANNVCEHDIWIDDTEHVVTTGNICRRLRVTVSGTYDVDPTVQSTGDRVAAFWLTGYGTPISTQRISASVTNMQISPDGRNYFGTDFASAIYLDTTWVDELTMQGVKVVSSATDYAVQGVLASNARLEFADCDFGSMPHSLSGTTGTVYERNCRNPIQKLTNGYIDVRLLSDIVAPTLAAWTTITLSSEAVDRNGEWSGTAFVPKEDGFYEFSGSGFVVPTAIGNNMGFRLYNATTSTEVYRLCHLISPSADFNIVPFSSCVFYITTADSINLQYFVTGASTGIYAFHTRLSIRRVG